MQELLLILEMPKTATSTYSSNRIYSRRERCSMEWILWVLIGAAALWIAYRFTSPAKGIQSISTEEMKTQLGKKDKQYIDVRTPGEFKGNHIKGFKNIPLNELPKRMNELSKEKEVLVICQSGMRSSKASQLLKKNGFTTITNIRGGMSSYRA